MKYQYLHFISC